MKKYAFYVLSLSLMLFLVIFVPSLDKAKHNNVAAASSPLAPHSSGVIVDTITAAVEGDASDIPYLKNGTDFQAHVKVDDYAGISDSIVSVMSCLKDSCPDPEAFYKSDIRTVLNTFGFGDKDVFIDFVSFVKEPPSYAVAKEIIKKNGYFYVAYDLYNEDDILLCSLEANHLFINNRYASSEYRLKK